MKNIFNQKQIELTPDQFRELKPFFIINDIFGLVIRAIGIASFSYVTIALVKVLYETPLNKEEHK